MCVYVYSYQLIISYYASIHLFIDIHPSLPPSIYNLLFPAVNPLLLASIDCRLWTFECLPLVRKRKGNSDRCKSHGFPGRLFARGPKTSCCN